MRGPAALCVVMFALAIAIRSAVAANTATPVSIAAGLCETSRDDLRLGAYKFLGAYLMCGTSDQHAASLQLYKRQADGRFKLIDGTGGYFSPEYLESHDGVPGWIARRIYFEMVPVSTNRPHAGGMLNTYAALATADPTATPPPLSVVKAYCETPRDDLKLYKYNYYHGYLLCTTSDENSADIQLYKRRKDGTFVLIDGAGGDLTPGDMESKDGVPAAIATKLYYGLHKP